MLKSKVRAILLVIILLAVGLRFYNLAAADVITDEALNGFRSIGYIDFFVSEFQKTPFDWLGESILPDWLYLSFHDHPPLVFLVQHFFFKLGGVNLWSLRLPFALAGVLSVYLTYLIARQIFEIHDKENKNSKHQWAGLLAAALLAINSYHVWVSRIGLQESIVICLNLLAVYLFLKVLSDKKFFIWLGLVFGLAVMAKYTSLVLGPLFLTYILIYRRDLFKSGYFYLRAVISAIVMLPAIIYNLKLWQTFGHFDFQVSFLLGQSVPDWQSRLGRLQAGSFIDKLTDLLPAIGRGVTPIFAALTALAFIYLIYRLVKKGGPHRKKLAFLGLAIVWHLLLLLAVGPRERFVALLIPYLVLALAYFILKLWQQVSTKIVQQLLIYLFIGFIGYELFFTYNTALSASSLNGREGWSYSRLKIESLAWGYNELDEYYPAFQFTTKYQFLENIKYNAIEQAQQQGKEPLQALIVYDRNMESSPTVWYIFRPFIYSGWPMIAADSYLQVLETEGADFFRARGIEQFYFIKATASTLLRSGDEKSGGGQILENELIFATTKYESILNQHADETFRVYKF
jgi:4-amino-4-deoxy-L-arabinose transferase-like glycosyltransferase